jgi:pyridinium-3,5-biscarboxylic acid mononucleotide sulfurtransferase
LSRRAARTHAALDRVLDATGRVAVAVSGGVDSLTLACAAHRRLGGEAVMYHAVSPAVPDEATERTRRHAERFGWQLEVIEAGEFADENYLRNPVNRCYFCKANLYGAIARHTGRIIVSGTNLDDLNDFRPGLEAAARHRVRHPFVEAGIDKAGVRAIAMALGLGETAELPASPCLASRLETGVRVTAERLALVHAVEQLVRRTLSARTVRCRIRRGGLVVELDEAALASVSSGCGPALLAEIERMSTALIRRARIEFAPYRMGGAFLIT